MLVNKKTKKTKKVIAKLLLFAIVVFNLNPLFSHAAEVVTPSDVSSNTVTPNETGTQGQTAQSKMKGPQVEVSFTGSLTSGSKVTAIAAPGGFSTADSKLYYTWFLQKKGCGLTDKNDPTGKKGVHDTDQQKLTSCDEDGDKIITVNDWKIYATRIAVKGNFDPQFADYSAATPEAGGPLALPDWKYTWHRDGDSDGENINANNAPDCYLQETESGKFFELRTTGEEKISGCPSGYHLACVKDTTTTCNIPGEMARIEADRSKWESEHTSEVTTCATIKDKPPIPPATVGHTTTDEEKEACKIEKGKPRPYTGSPMNLCVEKTFEPTDLPSEKVDSNGKIISNYDATNYMNCDKKETSLSDILNFHVDVACDQASADDERMKWEKDHPTDVTQCAHINDVPAPIPPATTPAEHTTTNDEKEACMILRGKPRAHMLATCLKDYESGLSEQNTDKNILAHILGRNNLIEGCNITATENCLTFETTKKGSLDLNRFYYDKTSHTDMCGQYVASETDSTKQIFKPGILSTPLTESINLPTVGSFGQEGSTCEGIINAIHSGGTDLNGNEIIRNKDLRASCTFEKGDNICKHLFPKYPKESKFADARIGSGLMTVAEKRFWSANPNAISTNGKQPDQAVLMGLGLTNFSWTYSKGDKVGVVVEGTSNLPTDHVDNSYRIVWALPNGTCDALKGLTKDVKGAATSESNGGTELTAARAFYFDNGASNTKVGILTADVDIDECLPENLIEPNMGEGQQFLNATVSLNASPENPTNDPDGRGDVLTVSSQANNMKNVSYLWRVFISKDGTNTDSTQWVNLTSSQDNKLVSNGSVTMDDLQGLDKNTLAILLNLPDNVVSEHLTTNGNFYLKVVSEATENNGEDNKSTIGQVVVKVTHQQNKIKIYGVSATSEGKFKLVKSIDGVSTELSGAACDDTACYVTAKEVVGLEISNAGNSKISNVNWKLNGNAFVCNSTVSADEECAKAGSKELIFPILGNVGESVDVVAVAQSCPEADESLCQTIEVSKHFVIVEPAAKIFSTNIEMLWPKLLGNYIDLDGNKLPDFSKQTFETSNGNTVTIKAQVYPASKSSDIEYNWSVDGESVQPADPANPAVIKFPVDRLTGESYSVTFSPKIKKATDEQAIYMRKALFSNWGIILDDTNEAIEDANILINVIDNPNLTAATKDTNFAASLITHLPQQLLFLLKITLTAFVFLFTTTLLFAFIPEPMFQEKERY